MNKHGGYYGDLPLEDRSINVNPLGTPSLLLDVLKREIDHLAPYPTPDARRGREALAKKLSLPWENILLGNGAISLLYLYARAKRHTSLLLIDPSFNEYARAFRVSGAKVHRLILEKPFLPSVEKILERAKEVSAELVVLCNPCNPTGIFVDREEIHFLYQGLRKEGRELFIDESFVDFVGEKGLEPQEGLFQLRSLTKFYGLAGLRLGYCVADEKTIQLMISMMEPWSVNHLAEKAILHLDELKEYEEKTLELIGEERRKLLQELDNLSLWTSASKTNFLLIHVKNEEFFDRMIEAGFYLRRCEDFAGLSKEYYRFSIGLPQNNQRFIAALKESLCFISS